jgi:hypothetical protein
MANFIPQIDIEVDPVFFVFSWKVHNRKVATLVSIDTKTRELVSIGERAAGEDLASIALFAPEEALPANINRLDLLQSFLEYNFAKLFENAKTMVLKPKIIFHEDQRLSRILCGYQRSLLEIAALAAGAKEVSFE